MTTEPGARWICCQLGAREHFAIPRSLKRAGALRALITDVWVRPGSTLGGLRRGYRDRYHPEIDDASVRSWNGASIIFEAALRAQGGSAWSRIIRRNRWFQTRATSELERLAIRIEAEGKPGTPVLFAYSYAALMPLRFARRRGWTTVLGQIDPGPAEERLVSRLFENRGELESAWEPAPEEYWELWREECSLADRIVVNSEWSRAALSGEVDSDKLCVVPLAYEAPAEAANFRRKYPDSFTQERPLRALFLGQVSLRKGVSALFETIRALEAEPIEFWIAGSPETSIPADLRRSRRVHWVGPVARSRAAELYRMADIFLFPSYSDGFGLTQLEAQAWALPVIASRHCGEVVQDGINGVTLAEVSATALGAALRGLLDVPGRLLDWSNRSELADRFSFSAVAAALASLAQDNRRNR